jgi:hypothetical protein
MRRPFRRFPTVALLATLIALGAGPTARGAGGTEHEIARVPVPSAERPHGEVVVLVRDDVRIVRTVLHSKVLRQVAGRIAGKERAGWPEGEPGRSDSDRYVEALGDGIAALPPVPAGSAGDDRKRSYLIEFVHGPGTSRVLLAPVRVEVTDDGHLTVAAVGPERRELDLSPAYVERNQRLIVEDAFRVDADAATRTLGGDPSAVR